jgi:hypothetical protein
MAVPTTEPLDESHLQLEQSSVVYSTTPSLASDAPTRKIVRAWQENMDLGSAAEVLRSIGANFEEADTSRLGPDVGQYTVLGSAESQGY